MKIEMQKIEPILFKDLNAGDVFILSGIIYMKALDEIEWCRKAINLETGSLSSIHDDIKVKLVQAILICKESEANKY
jgi:hypothetical protein